MPELAKNDLKALLNEAAMEKPAFVSPMLCESCRELPEGEVWTYEVNSTASCFSF
jgi:hypothetical protein